MRDYGRYPNILVLSTAFFFTGTLLLVIGLSIFLLFPFSEYSLPEDIKYVATFCIALSLVYFYAAVGLNLMMKSALYVSFALSFLGLLAFPLGTVLFGIVLYGLFKAWPLFRLNNESRKERDT